MQTNKDKVQIRVINMKFGLAFQYSFHGTLHAHLMQGASSFERKISAHSGPITIKGTRGTKVLVLSKEKGQ
jgi:hypothetical protein